MALFSCSYEPIYSESLEKWRRLDSGGFGYVYKARHKEWGFDVAVKLLHDSTRFDILYVVNVLLGIKSGCVRFVNNCIVFSSSTALSTEVNHMSQVSCDFVVRVYGIFEGIPPLEGLNFQRGIVMELMDQGSLQALLLNLSSHHPPWPLTFRLVHQVALGMNFLHSRNLIHQDLKPSNVLLNGDLNAKLADFGLSRISTSALSSNRPKTVQQDGGSYKYMPPEAFQTSYEPVRAFDRYSYGILLWSTITGKEPYPYASFNLVELKIPKGQRPPCENINFGEAVGLREMVNLMRKCWDGNPSERPTFEECLIVTESVFSKHVKKIHDAVHDVLRKVSKISNQLSNPFAPEQPSSSDCVDTISIPKPGTASAFQERVSISTKEKSIADRAKFVDDNRAVLIQEVSEVMSIIDGLGTMVHRETYSVIKAKGTSQEKMRALFDRTLRAGNTVKAAFYAVLKIHHPDLVERLSG